MKGGGAEAWGGLQAPRECRAGTPEGLALASGHLLGTLLMCAARPAISATSASGQPGPGSHPTALLLPLPQRGRARRGRRQHPWLFASGSVLSRCCVQLAPAPDGLAEAELSGHLATAAGAQVRVSVPEKEGPLGGPDSRDTFPERGEAWGGERSKQKHPQPSHGRARRESAAISLPPGRRDTRNTDLVEARVWPCGHVPSIQHIQQKELDRQHAADKGATSRPEPR